MDLYKKFQPITWDIGVIDAEPSEVAEEIYPIYMPGNKLEGIYQYERSIDEALLRLEPIKSNWKILLIETVDGRSVLFNSCPDGGVQLPTWNAKDNLKTTAYYICNEPKTISKDQRSGYWGARILEYRTLDTPYGYEPAFGIQVVNDCGRWHFYRYGENQPFEEEQAYKARRKPDRFTVEMLTDYCNVLGIPVYDREFYTDKCIYVVEKPQANITGMTYKEAAIKCRITI